MSDLITRKPTPAMVELLRRGAADKRGIMTLLDHNDRTQDGILRRDMGEVVHEEGATHSWLVVNDAGRAYLAKLDGVEAQQPQQEAPAAQERQEAPQGAPAAVTTSAPVVLPEVPEDMAPRSMAAAVEFIARLKTGDRVRVTREGRTYDLTVSRMPRRSDGAFGSRESLGVTVTFGPGRYAFEVNAGHLFAQRAGYSTTYGGTRMMLLPAEEPQEAAQEPQGADGNPEHYVTVDNGIKMSCALGPYLTDAEARANLPRVRAFLDTNDPAADTYEYGTFRVRSYGRNLGPGKLNDRIGLHAPQEAEERAGVEEVQERAEERQEGTQEAEERRYEECGCVSCSSGRGSCMKVPTGDAWGVRRPEGRRVGPFASHGEALAYARRVAGTPVPLVPVTEEAPQGAQERPGAVEGAAVPVAVKGLTPTQRSVLAGMAETVYTMPSRGWRLSDRLSDAQVHALVKRGLAELDGTAYHALTPLGVAVAEEVAGIPQRRAAEETLRGALDALCAAEGPEARAVAFRAAGEALGAADGAGVRNMLPERARRGLSQVARAERQGAACVERVALGAVEAWRAMNPAPVRPVAEERQEGPLGGEEVWVPVVEEGAPWKPRDVLVPLVGGAANPWGWSSWSLVVVTADGRKGPACAVAPGAVVPMLTHEVQTGGALHRSGSGALRLTRESGTRLVLRPAGEPKGVPGPQERPGAPAAEGGTEGPQEGTQGAASEPFEERRAAFKAAAAPRGTDYDIEASARGVARGVPWGVAMAQVWPVLRRGWSIEDHGGGAFTVTDPDSGHTARFSPSVKGAPATGATAESVAEGMRLPKGA